MPAKDVLSTEQVHANLTALPQWRYGQGALRTALKCESSASALALFATIGTLAQEANHHPDVDWRYNTLFITLTSHDAGSKVTARDAALARSISAEATNAGAVAKPELLHTVQIAIDTDDVEAISESWRLALGYKRQQDGGIADPFGRGPGIRFQETATPNANRLQLDIMVPHSESAAIIDGLQASGASLETGAAPACVAATDAQGNRFNLLTEKARDVG